MKPLATDAAAVAGTFLLAAVWPVASVHALWVNFGSLARARGQRAARR